MKAVSLSPASIDSLQKIDANRDEIVRQVTDNYLSQHPNLPSGARLKIKRLCHTDMEHHLSFLLNAMKLGVPDIFVKYMQWLKFVLESRSVDTAHTSFAIEQIREIVSTLLTGQDLESANTILMMAKDVFEQEGREVFSYQPQSPIQLKQAESYTKALTLNQRKDAISLVMQAVNEGRAYTKVGVGIIQPAMYEIGRLWQLNKITVAQEHLATAITQGVMAKAYAHSEFEYSKQRYAMLACVEGNFHSLGLRMVSDAFEINGWDIDYLGENTPTDSLVQMVDAADHLDFVGISASMHDQVITLSTTIEQLRGELGSRCPPIVVGGLPINLIEGLTRAIKADDCFTDAATAVEKAK